MSPRVLTSSGGAGSSRWLLTAAVHVCWLGMSLPGCGDEPAPRPAEPGDESKPDDDIVDRRTDEIVERLEQNRSVSASSEEEDSGAPEAPAMPPACEDYMTCCEALADWAARNDAPQMARTCDSIGQVAARPDGAEICRDVMESLRETMRKNAQAPDECK